MRKSLSFNKEARLRAIVQGRRFYESGDSLNQALEREGLIRKDGEIHFTRIPWAATAAGRGALLQKGAPDA